MDKKAYLLSTLKRQVIALKHQLQHLQNSKINTHLKSPHTRAHYRSGSHSSRFNSVTAQFDRGIKTFIQTKKHYKNITEMVIDKSKTPQRNGRFSSQRQAEYQKTKANFSTDIPEKSRSRSKSPNPLTGEGYACRIVGKRIGYQYGPSVERKQQRRHFTLYY